MALLVHIEWMPTISPAPPLRPRATSGLLVCFILFYLFVKTQRPPSTAGASSCPSCGSKKKSFHDRSKEDEQRRLMFCKKKKKKFPDDFTHFPLTHTKEGRNHLMFSSLRLCIGFYLKKTSVRPHWLSTNVLTLTGSLIWCLNEASLFGCFTLKASSSICCNAAATQHRIHQQLRRETNLSEVFARLTATLTRSTVFSPVALCNDSLWPCR